MMLGFRELGNNPLLCLALHKLLLNYVVDFGFPHFKRKCENWERSVAEWQILNGMWNRLCGKRLKEFDCLAKKIES